MMKRLACTLVLLALLVPGAGQADGFSRRQLRKLDATRQAYVAALRWQGFESALAFVDPAWRQAHPLDALHLARYQQLQVSGYHALSEGTAADGNPVREIELRAINRNTQVERSIRLHESWRWDPEAKRWWQTSGLPDFWDGR